MKLIPLLAAGFLLGATVSALAADLGDQIKVEALIVTKAELRRHFSAPEGDTWRPATYADLEASRGPGQPDYLVVRFRELVPGHYSGEAQARIDGQKNYSGEAQARIDGQKNVTSLNVGLHFNSGWVEYLIPRDGFIYAAPGKPGGPEVAVAWNSLHAK
jgi:hypothetical protein